MTDKPHIAGTKPRLVHLEKRKKPYLWCSCGKSATQPFCDGAHIGTDFSPVKIAEGDTGGEALLCMCKQTRTPPYCDGAHNALSDKYEEADADEQAAAAGITPQKFDHGDYGTAMLDGGCFVRRLGADEYQSQDGWRISPCIGDDTGAKFLSHFMLAADAAGVGALTFGTSGAALFVHAGAGRIAIGGRAMSIAPETGFYVAPGESFRIEEMENGPLSLSAVVCPLIDGLQEGDTTSTYFDERIAKRLSLVDEDQRETMADRFYQVLVGEETGPVEITQFIGEIPKSRAAAHRHLYEETITILSGEGLMWTENACAPVRPDDVIFLPRKQLHSLECTSEAGMRLMGAFYPSGSPAINY